MTTGSTRPGNPGPPVVTVLHSLRVVRPTTNPYLVMLRSALRAEPGVRLLDFSYRRALLGRYDAYHVHWPEILLEGSSPVKRAGRQLLLVLVLVRLTLSRIPVVRTRHNLERPSDLRQHEHRLLDWLDHLTAVTVVLNADTPPIPGTTPVTVEHGHYRDWFAQHPGSAVVPGQIGYAGLIRRYKGLEDLLAAFLRTRGEPATAGWTLRVGGRPSSAELARSARDLARDDPRVRLELRYLSDAELVGLITASELVVLPYRSMHNSGSALAALSLDRPVLVPENEVNRQLAHEVGPGWVHTFSGDLGAADLLTAVAAVRNPRASRPRLDRRSWQSAGRRHVEAYRLAVAAVRPPRRSPRRRPAGAGAEPGPA